MKSFPNQFQKVVDYIKNKKGVGVVLGSSTCFDNYSKTITIHSNHNLEKNGLYALLHEVGHSLQPETNTGSNLYKAIDDTEKPVHFAMYQFINEQDAWDKGVQVAGELGLKIDFRGFNKLKEESLLTYFKTTI
jgi:transposase